MTSSVVLNGAELARDDTLRDPKSIFEYIWSRFCLSAEQGGAIQPLVYFIRATSIEFYNFYPFTQDPGGREVLRSLICQRIQQESDIEGVAVSFEAFVKKAPIENAPEAFSKVLSEDPEAHEAIMLSLDWRGVGATYARIAKKIVVNMETKLVDITDTNMLQGRLSNFFEQDQLQSFKERATLQ